MAKIDNFDGDPFITISADGADMIYKGGQPVMDQGLVNHVNFGWGTQPGWWGNDIEPVAERKLGGKFLSAAKEPITRESLIDTGKALENDLKGDEFSAVTANITNPSQNNIRAEVLLQPPSNVFEILILDRVGQNWISQKINPAGPKEES